MFGGGFHNFFGGQQQQPQQQKEVDTTSLYEVLQLPKTASIPEIKKAYRLKAMKQHPDKGGDPEKFRILTDAYDILSNPQKKDLYDKYGKEGVESGGPPSRSFFDMGRQDTGPRKTKPKLIKVELSLKKVFEGGMHEVQFKRLRTCTKCEGKGGVNPITCSTCKGAKYVQKLMQIGPGMYTQTAAPCDKCAAEGIIFEEQDKCTICLGKRVNEQTKVINLAVEPGVPHDYDYIYTGQADQYPDILPGDVYFRVQILQDDHFRRVGADLYYKKKITLLEALTRVTFQLQLLDGNKILISTAPGEIVSHKESKVVKGKGMPFYKDAFSKGNLIIEFAVEYPTEIDQKYYSDLAEILQQPVAKPIEAEQILILEDYEGKTGNNKQQDEQWEDEQGDEDEQQHEGQQVGCQQQ